MENKNSLRLIFLIGISSMFIGSASPQLIGLGHCPTVEVKQDFNTDSYLKTWYEYARYPTFFEIATSCVKAEYFPNSGSNNLITSESNNAKRIDSASTEEVSYPIGVRNSAIRTLFFKKNIFIEGKARLENPSLTEAKLLVNFNGAEGSYWVLDTDYQTYSLVWSCHDFLHGLFHLKFFWVLTGDRKPTDETVSKIKDEIAKRSFISKLFLFESKQDNC